MVEEACQLSSEDEAFIDYVFKSLSKARDGIVFLYQPHLVGSLIGTNEWIREMFSHYTKSCLSVSVDLTSEKPVSVSKSFNLEWFSQWTATGELPYADNI